MEIIPECFVEQTSVLEKCLSLREFDLGIEFAPDNADGNTIN